MGEPETRATAVRREARELLKQPPLRLVEMVVAQRLLLAEAIDRIARLEHVLSDADDDGTWPPARRGHQRKRATGA